MRKYIMLILFLMSFVKVFPQAGWREIYHVNDVKTPFGTTIGATNIVYLKDSTAFYELKHLVTKLQTMDTVFANHWYKKITDPQYFQARTFEKTIQSDNENNWTLSAVLKTSSVIFYNSDLLPSTRWGGIGSATLNVYIDTKQFDHLLIIF